MKPDPYATRAQTRVEVILFVVTILVLTMLLRSNAHAATSIEWNNTSTSWPSGTSWVGGVAPADDLTSNIAAFGSTGAAAVNPVLTLGRSVNGVSFLPGAFSYNIGGTSALTIGTGGIVDSAANDETLSLPVRISTSQTWTSNSGNLFLNGSVDLKQDAGATARTLTVNGAGNVTFNGSLTNSRGGSTGNLTYSGTGVLSLANATGNSYNGTTTVSSGTLLVRNTSGSGTGTSAVTVTGSGTILGGGNTTAVGGISGAVSIGGGSIISPSSSTGSIAILNTGALTLNGTYIADVTGTGTTAGANYDQLNVTGLVNITGSSLMLNAASATLALNQTFTILNNDSNDAITGAGAWGSSITSGNYIFAINYAGGTNNNDVVLTVTAVPEPSTWAAGGLTLLAVGWMSCKRFRALARVRR